MTGWCAACGFRCSNDYVDIYTQLSRPDEPLLEAALHGRYCGYTADELPHLLVSMHELLVLILYTDGRSNDDGFLARYQFIDAGEQSDTPLRPPPLPGAATTWHTARLPSASGDDVLSSLAVYSRLIYSFSYVNGAVVPNFKFPSIHYSLLKRYNNVCLPDFSSVAYSKNCRLVLLVKSFFVM